MTEDAVAIPIIGIRELRRGGIWKRIARSIGLDDSIAITRPRAENLPKNHGFWTLVGRRHKLGSRNLPGRTGEGSGPNVWRYGLSGLLLQNRKVFNLPQKAPTARFDIATVVMEDIAVRISRKH
jgi:hypothetical protein